MNSEQAGWHLKKEIQVTHLISTITLGVAALVYVGEMKKDIEILKEARITQRETIQLLRSQLERMDAKLDRLVERAP